MADKKPPRPMHPGDLGISEYGPAIEKPKPRKMVQGDIYGEYGPEVYRPPAESYKKGGKVMSYCKGGKVISSRSY